MYVIDILMCYYIKFVFYIMILYLMVLIIEFLMLVMIRGD